MARFIEMKKSIKYQASSIKYGGVGKKNVKNENDKDMIKKSRGIN
jgi:hypothetical protein